MDIWETGLADALVVYLTRASEWCCEAQTSTLLKIMTRSDEAEWWFTAVYQAIQEIPYGKVTSYGHIARLLGRREPLPG